MRRRLHDQAAAVSRQENNVKWARKRLDDAEKLHRAENDNRKGELDAHHQSQLAELSAKAAELSTKAGELVSHVIANFAVLLQVLVLVHACMASYAYSRSLPCQQTHLESRQVRLHSLLACLWLGLLPVGWFTQGLSSVLLSTSNYTTVTGQNWYSLSMSPAVANLGGVCAGGGEEGYSPGEAGCSPREGGPCEGEPAAVPGSEAVLCSPAGCRQPEGPGELHSKLSNVTFALS